MDEKIIEDKLREAINETYTMYAKLGSLIPSDGIGFITLQDALGLILKLRAKLNYIRLRYPMFCECGEKVTKDTRICPGCGEEFLLFGQAIADNPRTINLNPIRGKLK